MSSAYIEPAPSKAEVAQARLWWERAKNLDEGMRAAAYAVWAQWYGEAMLRGAEVAATTTTPETTEDR